MNFGEAPDYYRRFIDPPDVVCIKTCPMDEHGYFNFSASVTYAKALTERAKVLVVETSPQLPYVYGGEESVHASEVDFVIEGPDEPPPELANPEPTEVDRKVAALIAAEIEDGACLQIGIGGMPNAVCSALKDAGLRDLGIHTEMLVDGMIDLIESGHRDRRAQDAEPLPVRLHLRARLAAALPLHPPEPARAELPGGLHQPAAATSCRTSAWSRSTTPRRSTCRARRPRSPTGTAT